MSRFLCTVSAVLSLANAAAALDQLNLILPNDRSLPMGEIGSIEASAVVARTSGASAAWYNPAGVAGQTSSEVMGSASIYEYSVIGVSSPVGNDNRRTVSVLPGAAGICEPLPEMFGGDGQWGVGFLVATPQDAQRSQCLHDLDIIGVFSEYRAQQFFRLVCSSLSRPVNVVMGLSGPAYSVSQLAEAGVRRVSVGGSFARAALGAFLRAAREVHEYGTFHYATAAIPDSEASAYMADTQR